MLSALGVVILLLGSLIDVIDISMAVIASLACVFAVIEYGYASAWLVYAVTSVLSLLLLPNKSPAVMYLLFFGAYPILKALLERVRVTAVVWLLKELAFNASLTVSFLVLKRLMMPNTDIPLAMLLLGAVLAEAIFVLYDIALTRLISFYMYRLRERFKFLKK